ncbi:MAG: chemotaxis protein CheB [Hymenobacteraceae bacterium]|mgnify:CR=1 FL=1|nr:chemotaxis protein CheB [Hymenobacteraceae bacterium]MDX5396854.1 chemotaxis protein CheB [Hymenobacteraceae bacterium]MDX5443792.1 chemotaxis protein CheB [Hymenobacteraceae bacterium]MDX5512926.1 chemotaxis protein CheB [Hymenobacteraceae bacterium]
MAETGTRIIVIGTSAGGMQALMMLLSKLPADLPAAIFIVQHVSADSSATFLSNRLNLNSKLNCKPAENNAKIEAGTVYMAPADQHLLLRQEDMLVVNGPRENQFRPSIDPLFRSAAAYHSSHVIGIILTGFMSDGVAGLEAIIRSGGMSMVQHPDDAEFPALPNNVLRQLEVDDVLPLTEMANKIIEICKEAAPTAVTVPADIKQEALIVERIMTNSTMTSIEEMDDAGKRTAYSCPECGGGLWELSQPGNVQRFRCHSGHAYTQDSLLLSMSNALEETLWVALRTLEERRNILLHMSGNDLQKGNNRWATMQENRAEEMKVHIERLRELLTLSAQSDEEHIGKAM